MLRFRQMKTLQKFASVHASLHNQLASPPFGSIRNAISPIDRLTKNDARQRLPSGVTLRPEGSRPLPQLRLLETNSH